MQISYICFEIKTILKQIIMKRIFSVALFTGCTVFLLSTVAVGQQKTPPPPPPPKAPKTEKHIKMVKVDDKGNKVELDTVLTSNEPFIWNGDTIGGGKEMKWISKEGFKLDSVHQNYDMNFEYKIEDDGKGNVIFKSGKGGDHMMMPPMPPGAPMPPHVMMLRSHANKNVIDLSDPGIISYDKKIQKDGTEKITIVRKQVPEGEEAPEDVLIGAPQSGDVFFYGNAPKHVKTVKVIKSDDGTTKVFEDENVIHMEGPEGTTKFVGDDGKVIIVKEIKEGDQKKVEVTVEEEKKEIQEKK
jgi:hypothetical protein